MGKRILSLLLALILTAGVFPAVVRAEPEQEHVHELVFVERKEPTCTGKGVLEHYHCEGCRKNFEDPEGKRELKTVVIPATGHDWGKTEYRWEEDGSACLAKRTCRNDPSHTETAEGQITRVQSREPEPDFPGEITCTAVFDADWTETQTKKVAGTLEKYFTLTFETFGGTEVRAEMHPKETEVSLSRGTVRVGYTFTGWYLDESLTKPVSSVKLTEDTTVYAGWKLTDVPSALESKEHPAYLAGYENNRIKPENSITRAETATIFFRLLTEDNRLNHLTEKCSFRDVPSGAWYRVQVATIAHMGILKGREDRNFAPNAPITRAEFATICVRFAEQETGADYRMFTDTSGHWAEKAISQAAVLGWIGGYEDGSFRPDNPISRGEAATLVNRMLRRLPQSGEDLLPGMHTWADCTPDRWYYLAVQEASNGHSYERKNEANEKWTGLQTETIWSSAVNYRNIACYGLKGEEPYVYASDFAYDMGLFVESAKPLVLGSRDRVTFENGTVTVNGRKTDEKAEIIWDADGKALLPVRTVARAMDAQVSSDTKTGEIDILAQPPHIEVKKGINVPVLMYHAVSDNIWGIKELFVKPAEMEKQLAYLKKNGYDPIWFEDLNHVEDYDKPVILTFDDGYDDNYTELFPLLKKYQVKATVFVIGNAMGWSHKMTRAQVREMSDSGLVSIQSHGYTHDNMDSMNRKTLEYELTETKKVITEVTGRVPYVLCYPSGKYSNLTLQVAREHYRFGIKMTGGLYNTSHNPYLVNRYYISRNTDIYTFGAFVSSAGT